MRLQRGMLVGGYEITAVLGTGGMGEVYRARDQKLKREVALKVLPATVAGDPERLARFQREAEVLASLNHPNIAHLHGLVEDDGTTALVMELVEGEDLAQRLTRGPIPVDEALALARQIAEAIDAAHDQGIVHRDLKPANIKLREDGTIKVLDFGLAKALDPIGSHASDASVANSPTITSPAATLRGEVLGTAAYMSPEQARGKRVDKRTDIWAFGVIVFEMLTARRPFHGETVSDSIAAILKSDPDWSALPADTPFLVRRLLRHCLNRDPRERLADIRDARIEIAEASTAAPMEMPTSHSRLRLPMVIAIASLALLAAGAAAYTLGWIQVTPSPLDLQEIRFRVDPPEKVRATMRPVVSPDGRYIAFVGFDQGGFPSLWIHTLATGLSKRLPGTERVVIISSAFWSPDSNALGFFADGKLKTVTLDGGAPVNLCDAIDGRGGAWNRSGDIVFAGTPNGPLFRVAAAGGAAQPVTDASGGNSHRFPYFLSDGDHFVFIASGDGGPRLLMGSLTSKSTKQLRTIDALAGTADRDQVLFVTQGHLFVQRIDMVAGALAGEMVDVTTLQPLGLVGTAWASASNNGTIVYRPTPTTGGDVVLAWVDRHGKATQVSLPPRAYRDISLSQDGRQIAMSLRDESGQHIWVYDTLRGSFGKRTFESQNAFPIWSRDGRSLTFATGEVQNGDVVRIDADGGGSGEALIKSSELSGQKVPTSWSADNMFLALQRGRDVYVRSADGKVTPLLASGGAFEREGRFAPSGRWIAYRSDETGRDEVYVQSYPLGNGKWQISTDGGAQAMWSAKGTELFYKNGNQLMAVPVEFEPTFKPGTPRLLFQMPLPESTVGDPSRYAVTPDGERFLVTTTETAALDDPPVHVILNWRGMHDTRQ